MENLGPHILFMIGPLPVTTTVVATWLVMGFLVLVSILITRKLQFLPGRWQNLLELFVEGIMNLINDMAPTRGRIFLPLVGTLALFI